MAPWCACVTGQQPEAAAAEREQLKTRDAKTEQHASGAAGEGGGARSEKQPSEDSSAAPGERSAGVVLERVVVDIDQDQVEPVRKLELQLSPWHADRLPVVVEESEGVDGSELILGRGHASIPENDMKLPRRNMRLYCEASTNHPEGLVWKVESTEDGRRGEVERDGKRIPIPPHGQHLHLHDNDILHQRKSSSGKPTHPVYVQLKFSGELLYKPAESEEEVDTESQSEDEMHDSTPPSVGMSLTNHLSDHPMEELMRSEVNAKSYGFPREGVEIVLGRGRCGVPPSDVKLPRQHIRLFCATEVGDPQQWECQLLSKRPGMIVRGEDHIPIPNAPESLKLLHGDIVHHRNVRTANSLSIVVPKEAGVGETDLGPRERKPTYARKVWLAPASTRETLSFRNIYVQQSMMTNFYVKSNRIPEHEAPVIYEIEQAEMIDFYGRKGAGGGESLAVLARVPEPEPEPEPEILAQP
jgi:hypothetical protein